MDIIRQWFSRKNKKKVVSSVVSPPSLFVLSDIDQAIFEIVESLFTDFMDAGRPQQEENWDETWIWSSSGYEVAIRLTTAYVAYNQIVKQIRIAIGDMPEVFIEVCEPSHYFTLVSNWQKEIYARYIISKEKEKTDSKVKTLNYLSNLKSEFAGKNK